MALRFLDDNAAFGESRMELSMLSYIAGGMGLAKLRMVMVMDGQQFESCLETLQNLGLLSENKVTRFGLEVLRRGGRKIRRKRTIPDRYINYYPSSFLGFQRDV